MDEKEKVFLQASFDGNKDLIEELLEEGVNIAASDEQGDNCLHKAVKGENEEFIEFMFEKVPSLQLVTNNDNLTPLEMITSIVVKSDPFLNACLQGNLEEVKKFLNDGDLKVEDEQRDFGACFAALHNKAEVLEFLIEKGCDINRYISSGEYKGSALHAAVSTASLKCIDVLLRYGCDVNLQDKKRMTALMKSVCVVSYDPVYNERLEKVFEKLVATKRCDYTLTDIVYGDNVLHVAAIVGNIMALNKLLENAPTLVNTVNKRGYTALHSAVVARCKRNARNIYTSISSRIQNKNGAPAFGGGDPVIDILLNSGKSILDKKGVAGETALQLALMFDQLETTEILISNGADCTIQNDYEETVLHCSIRKFMCCCGNNTDECNKKDALKESESIRKLYQNLPQNLGTKCVNLAIAVYLIKNGNADIRIKNINGESPLDLIRSRDVLKSYFNEIFCNKLLTVFEEKRDQDRLIDQLILENSELRQSLSCQVQETEELKICRDSCNEEIQQLKSQIESLRISNDQLRDRIREMEHK